MNPTDKQLEYAQYLASPEWKNISEQEHPGDLVCLCRNCHGLYHEKRHERRPKAKAETRQLAKPKVGKFFRKAATKLSIPAETLERMGHAEVDRLLVGWRQNRIESRRARRQKRADRMALKLAEALSAHGATERACSGGAEA